MARGRLTDASITAVREAARIDQVIGEYVTLKKSGPSIKGLCPFHDEKSPSFHVNPDKGYYHCFGCQVGGDVLDFIQQIDGLTFIESIERLADRFRVELNYEETTNGPSDTDRQETRAVRARLLAANKAASDFYTAQLVTPEGITARRFLSERGFDRHAAADFGCGYAPNGWDVLVKHLKSEGFTPDELTAAGLTSEGKNGPIDRFRGRLIFPIRDQTGDIIGFGARKLLTDEDDKGPKYLNTPETSIYKKSKVLYGLDKARKSISKDRKVVIVEGYTDVMACHLSGETTAVATCGTAFGEDHIRIVRRLLGDDGTGGEVIYTFDGDSAGQKAALRAFTMDDHFQTRTSVAVDPNGMDPCEVRIQNGPEGVHALLEDRIPLFEFAIRSTLSQFNLATPEGRANALDEAIPMVATLRRDEMRDGYIRRLSSWTGTPREAIRTAVLARTGNPSPSGSPTGPGPDPAAGTSAPEHRTPHEPESQTPDESADPFTRPEPTFSPVARDALKVMLQNQRFVQLATAEIHRNDFAHPTHKAVWDALMRADQDPSTDKSDWVRFVIAHSESPTVTSVITELSLDPVNVRVDINHDSASKTYLALVLDSCLRRTDYIERALDDADEAERVQKLFADLERTRSRAATAQERLNQIDGVNT